jgi:hypothetical protein
MAEKFGKHRGGRKKPRKVSPVKGKPRKGS